MLNAATVSPPDQAVDLDHLRRMTLGDRSLQREVLQLFDRQSELLIARLRVAEATAAASLAHTLVGSARGIGAWRVAQSAEAVEQAGPAERDGTVSLLAAAVDEARASIADLLQQAA